MFISLYGGLIIILRLIAPFLIKLFLKIETCLTHRNVRNGMYLSIERRSRLMTEMSCHEYIYRATKYPPTEIHQINETTEFVQEY